MAVQAGWVGTSAKAETKKAWMGEARLELRLPKSGWMSEMIGKSTEVRFINTVNRTQASIHALMGSPTAATVYIFENTATITAATQGGWALQTGTFPAGSTLKIINRGHIRGGGGNGAPSVPNEGGTALVLNFPVTIDNTGTIWGGGGGGGSGGYVIDYNFYAGSGGAGIPAGLGGSGGSYVSGYGGTATAGGGANGGGGGAGGAAGNVGGGGRFGDDVGVGARGGYSVQGNGNAATWIAAGDRRGAVV